MGAHHRDSSTVPVVIKLTFMQVRNTGYGAGAQSRWLWRTWDGTNNPDKSVWKKVTTTVNVTEHFNTKELLRFGVSKTLIVKIK